MPNSTCDLHLHTYYSDGRGSPADVLHYAAGLGLKTIALTDHDNLNATIEAQHVADELALELIPGIELTTDWNGQDVDLLGYYFDPKDSGLRLFAKAALEDLRDRIQDCCALLTLTGYPISIHEVLEENPRYTGALQLLQALCHKGYARTWDSALPLFSSAWAQVRHCRTSIFEAITALHAAGGVAVLAHPVSVKCAETWLQSAEIAQLAAAGMDGLEIYHPRLDGPARRHFTAMAKEFDLLITGGSDEHGWQNGFTRMGSEPVTYTMVTALRQRNRMCTPA